MNQEEGKFSARAFELAEKPLAVRDLASALAFAADLTGIVVGRDGADGDARDQKLADAHRMEAVLKLLIDRTPVSRATLWKVKDRAGHTSVVARPWLTHAPGGDYTYPIDSTLFGDMLAEHRAKQVANPNAIGVVSFPDMSKRAPDGLYFTETDQAQLGRGRMLSVPFGSLCKPDAGPSEQPNFLLVLTLPPILEDDDSLIVPSTIFQAVTNKLLSGVCALIDRRMKRITEAMAGIRLAHLNADAELAIRQALRAVLPRFVLCESVMWLVPTADGFNLRINDWSAEGSSRSWPSAAAIALGEAAQAVFAAKDARRDTDERRADSALVLGTDLARLNAELSQHGVVDSEGRPIFNSLLVGRVHNRSEHRGRRGYVLLANRLNDLADLEEAGRRVPDWFDWEDELYLNHICSILDLIAELYTAEMARLDRAHILAHEIMAPADLVYATAERLFLAETGQWAMPAPMRRKELEDMMLTAQFQTALVNSLMIGLQETGRAPAERYAPRRTDLNEVAKEVSLILLPFARRYQVARQNIHLVGRFPTLVIDKKAVTQVFMNLMSNAMKYAFAARPEEFNLHISVEDVQVEELGSTALQPAMIEKFRAVGIRRGWLFRFEDRGIGVSEGYQERIFRAGTRDMTSERVASRIGAGLGLSVVRTAMRDHFGEAWLEQRAGPTVFHLFFPDLLETGAYTQRDEWKVGPTARAAPKK